MSYSDHDIQLFTAMDGISLATISVLFFSFGFQSGNNRFVDENIIAIGGLYIIMLALLSFSIWVIHDYVMNKNTRKLYESRISMYTIYIFIWFIIGVSVLTAYVQNYKMNLFMVLLLLGIVAVIMSMYIIALITLTEESVLNPVVY